MRFASQPQSGVISAHGRLYFIVGTTLWQSDGTAAGTGPLMPFRPVNTISNDIRLNSTIAGDTLYFNGWNAATGVELWKIAPPHADAGSGYATAAGNSLQLNGANSSDPDPGEALQYSWDLDGDGIFGETGPAASRGDEIGPTPSFSSSDLPPGVFTVRLRVTDSIGLDSL